MYNVLKLFSTHTHTQLIENIFNISFPVFYENNTILQLQGGTLEHYDNFKSVCNINGLLMEVH